MSSMPSESAEAAEAVSREEALRLYRWQVRLLPLIVRIVLGVTVFFFAVSLAQIIYLHWRIELSPRVDLSEPLRLLTAAQSEAIADRRESAALMISALLEANALERRHHQARVVLMARVWTSYLGFVTGMALALVGAAFILGRVQGTTTTVRTEIASVRAELATAAPGIVLVFLGVVLMISTLFVGYKISVEDVAVYLQSPSPRPAAPTSPPPPFSLPPEPTAPSGGTLAPK
jgi:hypothetical protein